MKYRSFNAELQTAVASMLDTLNDVTIDRRNSKGTVQQLINVPCVYGNSSRIFKSQESPNKTVELPLMCLSMKGLTRDLSRIFSINDYLTQQDGSSFMNYKSKMPQPINISFNLEIITKFQEDMDQIISNFSVWFCPDIFVISPHPANNNVKLKQQIVWNGNIDINYPEEATKDQPTRIIANTSFTFKTWLFPGMGVDDYEGKKIKRINFNGCIGWDTDGVGRLQGWHAVPSNVTFDKYKQDVLCGYIDPRYTDQLQITGGVSGYWSDISALVTGDIYGINISGDPCYLTTSDGGVIFITNQCYLPRGMSNLTLQDYINYYTSTVSGELSGYKSC